jgi:signal transduction histidine kinase
VTEEYGVQATFHPPEAAWDPDDERDAAIYRIAREAAVNAARHGSPPLDIRLDRDAHGVVMRVEDAGGRIDGAAAGAGIGMRMMRERAARIGGRLEVRSEPERLTSIVLRVPVHDE